jgi:Sensors of blue-light using FAD
MFRRIVSLSRPKPGLALPEIPRIVSSCRRHNEARGITGLLLFTGLDFAQLLEGPPQPVADLWAKICADERHRDLVRILDERVPQRWFEDWRVGFPTDGAVVQRIADWREHAGAWNEARCDELRRMFAQADAM